MKSEDQKAREAFELLKDIKEELNDKKNNDSKALIIDYLLDVINDIGGKFVENLYSEEENEDDKEDDSSTGLSGDAIKGIMMAAIFVVCAIGAILPYFFRSGKKGKYVLSMGTAFGGGVFLTAGLMHLLPDAIIEFNNLAPGETYPYVELIVIFGFLLIFFIEYILIDHGKHDQLSGHDVTHRDVFSTSSSAYDNVSDDDKTKEVELGNNLGGFYKKGLDGISSPIIQNSEDKDNNNNNNNNSKHNEDLSESNDIILSEKNKKKVDRDELESFSDSHSQDENSKLIASSKTKVNDLPNKKKRSIKDIKNKITTKVDNSMIQYSPFTVIILLLALSVHAFLEGFGLGCQGDVSQMTVYFVAIILHKIVETFSLSVSVVRSPLSFKAGVIVNLILVCMTPFGIGIGMIVLVAVGEDSTTADWISTIANSVSAGTFLYVSICEVIMGEFKEPFDGSNEHISKIMRWVNFLMLLLGIAVMASLALVC